MEANRRIGGKPMAKYRCTVCGYVYEPEAGDPDNGIKPGTPFLHSYNKKSQPAIQYGKTTFY